MNKELVPLDLETESRKQIEALTIADVKKLFCEQASEKEILLFLNTAKAFNLNPFKREIYLVKYKTDSPAQYVVGYEVYLKRAEKSPRFKGFKRWAEYTKPDDKYPVKAFIEIYIDGWTVPLTHSVKWNEYVQLNQYNKPNRMWENKPETMLLKVVTEQGFRLAFPSECGGLPYTEEEVVNKPDTLDDKKEIKQPPAELMSDDQKPLIENMLKSRYLKPEEKTQIESKQPLTKAIASTYISWWLGDDKATNSTQRNGQRKIREQLHPELAKDKPIKPKKSASNSQKGNQVSPEGISAGKSAPVFDRGAEGEQPPEPEFDAGLNVCKAEGCGGLMMYVGMKGKYEQWNCDTCQKVELREETKAEGE